MDVTNIFVFYLIITSNFFGPSFCATSWAF